MRRTFKRRLTAPPIHRRNNETFLLCVDMGRVGMSAQSDNVLFEQSRNVLLTQVRLGRWTKDNY